MAFAHLHVHTEYSLLDGACKIEPMLEKIKSMGQNSVAITDHGNMYGALKFYKAAKAMGIKPIIGCEVYVAPRGLNDKVHGIDSERYHLILLCENNTGYNNLIKIVSESWVNGFYIKPRVDVELLKKHSEGLIALSGCLFGEVSQNLLKGNYVKAKETALKYREIFGADNYYLEIQNHGIKNQLIISQDLIRLSEETGIPLAATNDAHYIDKSDNIIQQILICIQTNHLLGESTGLDFESDELYLKSEQEMLEAFDFYPEAVYNTQFIADRCNVSFEFGVTKLPHYDVPEEYTHFEWLRRMCVRGFEKRYGNNPPREYIERMNYELDVINRMGYTDYFLIVQDFVNYAKNMGIPVGPGRGSGAASICAYCIGITGIDPMKYNLLFERFLNPERVSMPDFDIDFCYERREEVIDYVISKYGKDHVAQIVTFGTMAAKAAIRDVGRVLGIPYGKVDSVAKLIPNGDISIESVLGSSQELKTLYLTDETIKDLIDYSIKVEGMPRHSSTHAAGVVITADPVDEYVPLALNDSLTVTQFTMKDLEQLGLLKMDFLGLRTLTVIDKAQKLINEKDKSFDINKIDIDDSEVYKMFSAGQTEGVFQFESGGMKRVLKQLKPKNIEDLIAVISLYRPGPAQFIDKFIANHEKPDSIVYPTEKLKNILDVTYGCIVYQEQVMQIFRDIAGYSFGRADLVRRAMAKKQHEVMLKERNNFIYGLTDEDGNVVIDGAVRRGVSEKIADELFEQMISFASYAFNKAHATAYAFVSYQTAYLKRYYPVEFFASLLTSFNDRPDKITEYISECNKLDIKVLPPDVNLGKSGFGVHNNSIVYCLSAVKNIGNGFIDRMVAERESKGNFTSFYDFCNRMHGRDFNRRAIEGLIKSGALDNLDVNRSQMFMSVDQILEQLDAEKKRNLDGQIGFGDLTSAFSQAETSDFEYPKVEDFTADEKLRMEKEVSGLYFSGHPMDKYKDIINRSGCDLINAIKSDNKKYQDNSKVSMVVYFNDVVTKTTRNNNKMAVINAEDYTGNIEIIAFSKVLESYRHLLTVGNTVTVKGKISLNDDAEPSVIADRIDNLSSLEAEISSKSSDKKGAKGLFIRFDTEKSPQIDICLNLLGIFEGETRTMMYFVDTKQYVSLPGTDVNDALLKELKKILGADNVIFNS